MKRYEDLFQIGDVTTLCSISRKMILNYENKGLITPSAIDPNSGYRYFSTEDIARIQLILDLRRSEMSLDEIGQYLNGKLSVHDQIEKLRIKQKQIELLISDLECRESTPNTFNIKEIVLPKMWCIKKSFVAKNIDAAEKAFISLYSSCIKQKFTFNNGTYHFCEFNRNLTDPDFFETENIHMSACICIDKQIAPKSAVIYPECKALSVSWSGSLKNSIAAYNAISEYIQKNNYTVKGFPREMYLEGNFSQPDNHTYITIIAVPIE